MTAAFDMARVVHDGDTLKGSVRPYLLHVLDVCSVALRHGADEDQAIAALLHDVVEDGGGVSMLDRIRASSATASPTSCRRSDSLEVDPTQKPDWWVRKVGYLDHLVSVPPDIAVGVRCRQALERPIDRARPGPSRRGRVHPLQGRARGARSGTTDASQPSCRTDSHPPKAPGDSPRSCEVPSTTSSPPPGRRRPPPTGTRR